MLVLSISVASAQSAVSTLAGTAGQAGYVNATGTAARFNFTNPSGVAVDSAGNIFVADALNHAIRRIDATTNAVTTFAGSATGVSGNGDGTGTAAFFCSPQALAIDGANNIYVADTGNHAIRMISSGGVVSTLAGTAGGANGSIAAAAGYVDSASGTPRFYSPLGIAVDRASGAAVNVFVADTQNNVIRQIVVASKVVTTLAGGGPSASGFVDDVNTTARLFHPEGIAANAAGTTLYVADTMNNRIRKIIIATSGATTTATVSTLAGSGAQSYGEGTGVAASFSMPTAVALDSAGTTLYVGDTLNSVIRSVVTGTGVTALVAGSPGITDKTDGLTNGTARFWYPSGVSVFGTSIYVVDTTNRTIRKIGPAQPPQITTQPTGTSTAVAGGTITLTAAASGNPTVSYQWQISSNSGVTWSNLTDGSSGVSGATTASLTISSVTSLFNGMQVHVVADNGVAQAASNAVTLTVTQVPVITNTVTNFYVTAGQALQGMTITASGSPTPTFIKPTSGLPPWADFNTTTGVVSGTPTDTSSSPFQFSVIATNSAGNSAAVTFTVTVQSGPAITTQPVSQSVQVGQTAVFTASASSPTGTTTYQWQRSTDTGVTWYSLSDGGPYSGTATGTLVITGATYAMNGDQFRLVATNTIGSSISNAAGLTVAQLPTFTTAATTTFVVNQSNNFLVQASGYPTPSLSVSGAPSGSWFLFNPNTGLMSGTPPADAATSSPYTFVITATNAAGSASQTFTLVVSPTSLVPVITAQPVSQSVGLTQNATFTVAATGNPAPSYQWQRYRSGDADWVNLSDAGQYSGTSTATLTITTVSADMNSDLYRVVATNTLGSTASNSASLSITVGSVFFTIAGQPGWKGFSDGAGSVARFNAPTWIITDPSGNAYVADASNHVIRKVAADGTVSTIAGTPGVSGYVDDTALASRFSLPSAIARDSSGNLYVADSGNHVIRMINTIGRVTTIAGSAGFVGFADGVGANARFSYPSGIAVDASGIVYIADTLNNKVRRLINGGSSYTVSTISLTDSSSGAVSLSLPNGIAVDASSNLYIADTRNHCIRKVTPTGVTTVLAGSPGIIGSADGAGTVARFNQPQGLTVLSNGNVLVADTYNYTIRQITPAGVVTTIAGTVGVSGSADGGAGTVRFNQPYGVASDTSGNIWVADTFNSTIRRSGAVTGAQITTEPQNQSVRAGETAMFTVVATGAPTPSYQWQRLAAGTTDFVNLTNSGSYAGVNSASLVISGTTESMNGDQFQVIVNNLVSASVTSSTATLSVLPAVTAPQITVQPSPVAVTVGQTASFTVVASGTAPFTYQWTKDGGVISGATSSMLSIGNVQLTDAGVYAVTVTNGGGSVTSASTGLTVNAPPAIVNQPHSQMAIVGTQVTFSVVANGTGMLYQWRKNGVAILGATNSTLTLPSLSANDAGNYDVVITNSLGSLVSSVAQLTVVTAPVAPSLTSQPKSQTGIVGSTITLLADASAAPTPSYQWRKNGSNILGATNSTLTLSSLAASDAANYDVVIYNTMGSVTTSAATVRVIARSYAGAYFGSFSGGLGSFALYVRFDNTGIFLGYIPGSTAPVTSLNILVNDNGQFTFTQAASSTSSAVDGEPVRAAAIGSLSITGNIGTDGSLTGSMSGGAIAALNATRASDSGASQSYAGFYMAGSGASGAYVLTIASANGQAFALVQSGAQTDGGTGSISASGAVSVSTSRTTISEVINSGSGTVSANATGVFAGSYNGALESALGTQRLVNISTRARISGGEQLAIAGFVISGTESKPVLIRAVGPSLSQWITSPLANPKLELFRTVNNTTTLVTSNTGVSTAPNAAAISAAADKVGAFPLTSTADSAILTTLTPGLYTAQVSSATAGAAGIALIEVYDLSAAAVGQKLVNISTRAAVGSGDNAILAGVVINGSVPKRVLIRAIGPGLSPYAVQGVLAKPVLKLKTPSGAVIASNVGWQTSTESSALSAASAQVGGFPMAAADSAMIVTLTPGSYSAEVTSADGSTGVALVEIYELQ